MIVAEKAGLALVNTGGEGGADTLRVKVCEAFGLTPLLAVTVTVKLPVCVGVPEMTPVDDKVIPVGRLPDVSVKLGVGKPIVV